ncbi:MAG: ABC transporter substrate-binding protein [Proteobacteria bacterium]|nr:ABC transporter substrate-binding protein [Pseudomonadota bacterium]
MNLAIIWREWFNHKVYPLLFSLCLLVSLGAFLTLDALQYAVDAYIDDNQKQIVGGDLIVQSNEAIPDKLINAIKQLDEDQVVFDYQFNTIAYTDDNSLLTRVKAVSSAYPLYGEVQLASGKALHADWPRGSVIVEQQVLNSLNLVMGDSIQIGEASFVINDEILVEPDRPLTAFGFGSRVIMHDTDLESTALLGQKSRVSYRIEIKVPLEQKQILLDQLSKTSEDQKIEIKTAEESNTSISALSQNFLVFLKLLVVAVIVLSGIGLMSIVRAFVYRQQNTNAIRRALGEPSFNIINSYRLLMVFMALVSVFLAWMFSLLMLYLGSDVFAAVLPHDIRLMISWPSLIKAILVALGLTAVMTHMSLKSLHLIKPVAVLQQQQQQLNLHKLPWLWMFVTGFGLWLLIYSELGSIVQSIQVLFGLIIIWLIFSAVTKILMYALKWLLGKNWLKSWMLKLALQNIFRKGNQSALFITTLSMTTMVLGSITILDHSIQQQLISTYPDDAPNFFLLDVQTEQQPQLDELIGESLVYYPVVRARIESVNGIKAEVLKTKLGRYDNISRVFNLSYSQQMMETEELSETVRKGQLFADVPPEHTAAGSVPVSILNSFAEFLQVDIGDQVIFNVQGIKITSHIDSIRKRLKRGPSPFFYFIFQPEVLKEAPQIRFATAKLDDSQRIRMQTLVAKTFPGITTLDGGNIAKKLKEFVDQLKHLVQIFTALSLLAGLLIFVASLVSTSQDRLRESHYYRLMGMQAKDLYRLSLIEFLGLGLFAFLLGNVIAATVAFLITSKWFSLAFIFPWQLLSIAIIILSAVLIVISTIYSHYVRKSKVIHFIRAEN